MLVDDSKIFLYGLPLDCQEGTLKDFLEAVCDNPGAVIKVSIPDKKTFAFVTLSCTEVAEHLLGNTLLYCDGVGQLYQVKACPYVKQPFKKKKVQDYKPKTTSMEIIELKAVKYKPQDHVHQLTPDYSMLSHSKPKRRKRKRDELAIWLGDVGSTTFKRKTPRQKKRKKKASKLVLHKSESFQFGNLCPESKAITTNIEDTTDTTGAVEPVVYENGQRLNKAITTNIEDTTDTTGLVEPVVHENGQRLNKAITTNIEDTTDTTGSVEPVVYENGQRLNKAITTNVEDTTDTTGSVEPVVHENGQRLSKVKDKVPEVEIKHADDQKSSSTISSHTQVIIDRDYLGPLCLQFTSPPSVADVKNELMEKTGLPVKEQLLCYNGKKLSDSLDLRPLIDDNPDSLTLVLSAVTLNGGAAPQHQANSPDVVADSASEPSVAPRHQAPPAEVAAAIAPEPLSELEACGPITTHKEASDPDCKDDFSRDSADSIHSLMATQHKMRNIITATMKFEAEHEECVRVLPYLEGDQVVVQFYVFSGESGIPKQLKLAAEECFEEMGVKCKWSDLYNDKTDILKVTPLEYPSGGPKRLNVSQVDEISEIISKNLHVLDQHRNVTSLQASFKITKSVQTDIPCITIYVLGKGFIPVGEFEFPHTIGPYPVDVVDGFWFRTAAPWTPNFAQEQSEVLRLGASIGIQGKKESGTLGAIVEDGGTYYALSCDHLMRYTEKEKSIIHPGLNDHLNYLKYHLREYREMIKGITEHGSLGNEFSIEDLEESKELFEKFEVLKSIKCTHVRHERCTEEKLSKIQEQEKAFEEKLLNPPRVIGNYMHGVSENVKWNDKEYFVDAAIAKLTAKEINSLRSEGVEMIGTSERISGDCSEAKTEAIMKAEWLCKSGRATQYTKTYRLVGPHVEPPAFMKPDLRKIDTGPLFDIKDLTAYLHKEQWLKNCLCIVNGRQEFANKGDSGAVIFEVEKDLSGFGIIFAVRESRYQSCVIASPLQVALETLSKKISKDSNLKLVSNFAPQHQAPSPKVAAVAAPGPSADSVYSPMLVEQTMIFEGMHEECVRVLPYLKGSQEMVQFYVFSGESGIPKQLKLDAEECFREMELKWSDLYNDAANILKVTTLKYSSDGPKRLIASQVDEISQVISENLHVLKKHRNVTSVQASYKIRKSKQTDIPCITIYVLGKGFIPIGESAFPQMLGSYPVDVVNGFWYRTANLESPKEGQMQSEVLRLGASIGVQGEKESGTLGAIVEDGGTYYALSCNHVMMKHPNKLKIIHPGLDDHLHFLQYNLNEYRHWIERIIAYGFSEKGIEFTVTSLREFNELSKKFEELKSIKEKYWNGDRNNERKTKNIKFYEERLENRLNPPRVIGKYIWPGVFKNVKWNDGNEYFIDAAIAELTPEEVNSLRESGEVETIGPSIIWGDNVECSPTTTDDIINARELFKFGRTTEHTTTDRVINAWAVDPPHFLLEYKKNRRTPGLPFFDVNANSYVCRSCNTMNPIPFCKDCRHWVITSIPRWRNNCLCINRGEKAFSDKGDSGAVIFESNKERKLGFGIIFGDHLGGFVRYTLASPLQVALAALSKTISEHSNLRLVTNFENIPTSPMKVLSTVPLNQAPPLDVPEVAVSGPNVAPQHQDPLLEVAAAAASEPLSELETRGQMTTDEKASDPDCKDDISRGPVNSIHSLMATRHKMRNVITATMKFEAEHEECVRVLPYLEGDQVVVQFYVFSGESGIPKHLRLAAEECFEEMEVDFRWSDLYNDAADILKVTPLEYPSGEPKRLNASQVDEISEIISKNLHILNQHRNVTSVQASFKITKSLQRDIPCITIYVLGKGFIPVGESEFPHTIGPYPVDVVDGFWFRTNDPWFPNKTQEQSKVLGLGASIGVQGEEASGTLGAIVEGGGTLYALSCDHVMQHLTKSEIIHPGLNDYLNYLKYHLNEYKNSIKGIVECSSSEINSLKESNKLSEKFEELKSIKGRHVNSERWTDRERKQIKVLEEAFERGLNPPRVIGKYITGISHNVKWTDGKDYFIDVAIAELTPEEVDSLRENETIKMIGKVVYLGDDPSGKCSPTTTTAIMNVGKLCKNGRTTGYTTSNHVIGALVDPPHFMKPPLFQTKLEDPLLNISINRYFRKSCVESRPNEALLCDSFWRKNCLCIDNGRNKFADSGDSGAVIFEEESMLGYGIIFAIHENAHKSCSIASPLQVALTVLSEIILKDSNLRLVSNFVVPGRPTITKPEGQVKTSFTLTWNRPAYDGGDPNIKYKVEWRKKPVDSNTSAEEVDNIGETSLRVSDLEGGEAYEFKVFAQNAEGYSEPAIRSYSVQREDGAPQDQMPSPE